MRRPQQAAGQRGNRRSQQMAAAAPIGGWNTLDSIANMAPTDAVLLDNLIAAPNSVVQRLGCIDWVTDLPGPAHTLMSYNSGTLQQLFAVAGGNLYDVTNSGIVGTPIITGLSTVPWQYVNFGTPGGQFLVMVNGTDSPLLYNGTAWQAITNSSTPIAITGVDPKTFINVQVFANMLWFVQKGTLSTWNLPVYSIGGAAAQTNYSSLFRRGGYLVAMGDWTIDAGFGMFDNAVFVTSEGEVAVYRGTDPTTAANWSLIGLYRIGAPVGYRCLTKYGSDLLIINQDGLLPLSQALLSSRVSSGIALSNKIQGAMTAVTSVYKENFGWQSTLFPAQNLLILNIPVTGQVQQYVMNTLTNGWSRFLGWSAQTFELFENELYFGSDSSIKKAWQTATDSGVPIICEAISAFSTLGSSSVKQFRLARPIFTTDTTSLSVAFDVAIDYNLNGNLSVAPAAPQVQSLWDTAKWDAAFWGSSNVPVKSWRSLSGVGRAAAAHLKFSSNSLNMQWPATDFIFEVGSGL